MEAYRPEVQIGDCAQSEEDCLGCADFSRALQSTSSLDAIISGSKGIQAKARSPNVVCRHLSNRVPKTPKMHLGVLTSWMKVKMWK